VSFWSDLWVGDPEQIAAALKGEDGDEDALDGACCVLAHVHLPGILPAPTGELAPWSPDRLTAIANEVAGRDSPAAITFAAAHRRHLMGNPDEPEANYAAFEIGPGWVELFAGLDDDTVRRTGERWANEIDEQETKPAATDLPAVPIVELVTQIRDACRVAGDRGAGMVYSWTL